MAPDILASGMPLYLAGLLTGYLAVRYRLTISDRAAQVSDHLKDLEKLHEASVAFWSNPFDVQKGHEMRVKVLSSHAISMRIYPAISMMSLQNSRQYEDLVSEYFRACTGGEFDDPQRQADLAKALELSKIHAQLVEILRQIRCDLSSVSMLFSDFIRFSKRAWREFHYTFLTP